MSARPNILCFTRSDCLAPLGRSMAGYSDSHASSRAPSTEVLYQPCAHCSMVRHRGVSRRRLSRDPQTSRPYDRLGECWQRTRQKTNRVPTRTAVLFVQYNVQYYNQGDNQYLTCDSILWSSGGRYPGTSVFEIHKCVQWSEIGIIGLLIISVPLFSNAGIPLNKLVIGKPAKQVDGEPLEGGDQLACTEGSFDQHRVASSATITLIHASSRLSRMAGEQEPHGGRQ